MGLYGGDELQLSVVYLPEVRRDPLAYRVDKHGLAVSHQQVRLAVGIVEFVDVPGRGGSALPVPDLIEAVEELGQLAAPDGSEPSD